MVSGSFSLRKGLLIETPPMSQVPEQTPGNAAELPSSRRSRSTNDERALPYVVARP